LHVEYRVPKPPHIAKTCREAIEEPPIPEGAADNERSKLQTFPDDFIFCGVRESARRQIGMAVPPEGAKVISRL
jgi:site-specific DNA-cytosine methylase